MRTAENLRQIKPGEGLWATTSGGPPAFAVHVPGTNLPNLRVPRPGLLAEIPPEFLRAHGVDEPIDYTTTTDVLASATPVHGAVVSTSTDMLRRAAETVEPGGFLITILPDTTPDIAAIADRRGLRCADFLVAADGAGMCRIADLVADHKLRVHVAREYPLSQARAAFEQVASRRTAGKVVLIP